MIRESDKMDDCGDTNSESANALAVASYLGPLCLAPLLTREEDEFVRFHMKQGMVLLLCEVAVWFIFRVLFWVLGWFQLEGRFLGAASLLQSAVYIAVGVLIFIGVNNVLDGRRVKLPAVGKFAERIAIIRQF